MPNNGERLVHSEPIEKFSPELDKLADIMARTMALMRGEFDDKLAELKSRLAERQEKYETQLIELRAKHLKEIKRLTARLANVERKHAREIS